MLLPFLISALLGAAPQAPKATPQAPPLEDQAGAADVAVAPSRLILEGAKRSGELYLINTGLKDGHYQLSLVHFEMTPSGDLIQKDLATLKPEDHFAGNLLRFSPRELDLKSGESQVIRFRLRLPANLPDGEYRAHLFVRSVPSGPVASASVQKGHISLKIEPTYGVSVPILVRHGKVSAQAGLTDLGLSYQQGRPILHAAITRSGLASLYGNLDVEWKPADGKLFRPVGSFKGIGVYPEISQRPVDMELEDAQGMAIRGGSLRLTYRDPSSGESLAQAEFQIP
ncbi:MAG: hypothetical protein JST05_09875 [Acidobacteria bacterium]|nr:hypothetical protein [Acidobacteriota bacterium]